MKFRDRKEAGRVLAARLLERGLGADGEVVVVALPRGGIPVAEEIAAALDAPLDVALVRKLGVPGNEELAMGAIAEGGVRVLNEDVVRALGIDDATIETVARAEEEELGRRAETYRGGRPPAPVRGRTVVLVDDGLATGATMRVAARAVRAAEPDRLIIAVPVAPRETCEEMEAEADAVVCVETPAFFGGVGRWYADFAQLGDREVVEALERARRHGAPRS